MNNVPDSLDSLAFCPRPLREVYYVATPFISGKRKINAAELPPKTALPGLSWSKFGLVRPTILLLVTITGTVVFPRI